MLAPSLEGRSPAGAGERGGGQGAAKWPSVLQVWDAVLWFHLASHRCADVCPAPAQSRVCKCVCVCVCPAPAQPQACKCVHVCPASAQALRQLGSIPLLRTPSPPGPRFSLTQVTFQPFPSPLFLPPSPKSANQMWVWVVREGGSVPPPSQGSP